MNQNNETFVRADRRLPGLSNAAIAAFALLAAAGLQYVKWAPSWHRLRLIAAGGHMGGSILAAGGYPDAASWRAAWTYAWAYGREIWKALLLGLLLGTGVQALIPGRWVRTLFGGAGYRGVGAAGLIAVPSMMCTCCAAPVAVGLRQAGASARATLAYWLGNPALNPATLILIGFVLGWKWLALRLTLGVLLVFGGSYLLAGATDLDRISASAPAAIDASAAGAGGFAQSPWRRWSVELWRLAISLVPEYVALIFLLGVARAWLFPLPVEGHAVISGVWWTVALAAAGTLFAIPTAAEIPIVQTMMAAGLGIAPAAALLVTLPTVSLPSLAMMTKALPAKVLIAVGLLVTATGLLAAAIVYALPF